MKSKPIIIALLAGVAVVVMVFLKPSKTLIAEQKPVAEVKQTTLKPSLRRTPVQTLQNWTPPNPQQQAPKPVSERMKRATDDPYVAELLATFKPVEIGQIQTSSEGKQQLMLNGKLVFEARRIGSKSISVSGTLFVEAVTGELVPGAKPEGEFPSRPREIWRIMRDKTSDKVSPSHVDASYPVVSPNGGFLAYTGCEIGENGLLGEPRLYVVNLVSSEVQVFGETAHIHDYKVRAIDWVDDGKVLRVIEDWGETGGHMKLKQVRVE
jgi:hypothetical protein